jgi:hypothetical protein
MTIFSGKRYFNDILWAQAYNNYTLLLAVIRYNEYSYGKVKGK